MIPSRLRIGHRNIEVVRTELDDDRIGEYDYRHGQVRIEPDLKPDIEAVTLLHEVFHHLLAESGRNTGMSEEQEEEEVTFWASSVSALIADNPILAAYIVRATCEPT